jgi:hypothetical protein
MPPIGRTRAAIAPDGIAAVATAWNDCLLVMLNAASYCTVQASISAGTPGAPTTVTRY